MIETTTMISSEDLTQRWVELSHDEQSPDYDELTEYEELVLSPRAERSHQRICSSIVRKLSEQLGEEAVQEVAVFTTTAGIRAPNLAWITHERWNDLPQHAALGASDIVVEVFSPGNRKPEMDHQLHGYFSLA